MRWGGVLAVVLGVVVVAQVTRGKALSRLGIIDASLEGLGTTAVLPSVGGNG